ncbi:MAG TPA: TetR family transcriptional regulator [Streptosporangiaceae bacterium]|jgi:DNA-directed RNA polymerase specialized sigma24 family protein
MLGSPSEADDAVQEAWLRLERTDVSDVQSLGAWLRTVVSRVCLDQLRARAAEHGYERTTVRGIARAARVDAGLVMHYFGSKPELFQRVTRAAPPPGVSGTPESASSSPGTC